jgi:hypothetical protein
MDQVAAAYATTPDSVAAARAALETLRGMIGASAFDALMGALAV